jgi:hypothetical protein
VLHGRFNLTIELRLIDDLASILSHQQITQLWRSR